MAPASCLRVNQTTRQSITRDSIFYARELRCRIRRSNSALDRFLARLRGEQLVDRVLCAAFRAARARQAREVVAARRADDGLANRARDALPALGGRFAPDEHR